MKSISATAASAPATKTSTNANGNGNQQPEKKAEIQPAEVSPIEKQRERAQRLNDLFEKEDKLTESRDMLKSFRLASDDNTNSLTLQDNKGTTFKTNNPVAIADVLELVRKTIDAKLAEVQQQIISC